MYALKVMAQIFLEMELPNGRIVHPDDAKGLR